MEHMEQVLLVEHRFCQCYSLIDLGFTILNCVEHSATLGTKIDVTFKSIRVHWEQSSLFSVRTYLPTQGVDLETNQINKVMTDI